MINSQVSLWNNIFTTSIKQFDRPFAEQETRIILLLGYHLVEANKLFHNNLKFNILIFLSFFFFQTTTTVQTVLRVVNENRREEEKRREEKKREEKGTAYLILVVLVWLRLGCLLTGALYPLRGQQIHQLPQAAAKKLSLKCFDINP